MIRLASLAIVLLAIVGCQNNQRDDRSPTQQDVYSSARLETAPLTVRAAFRRDYPNATVSAVETMSPQDGPLLYVITFYDNGRSGSASYTQDGTLFRLSH